MELTKKIYLSLAIFIFLSIILIVFIIYPLFTDLKRNSEQLISQKQNLASLEAKIENLEEFSVLYQNLKLDLEKIDALFINPAVPVEFISFLERAAENCQIPIKISPASPRKIEKEPWPHLIFQISAITSFPKFLRFVEKLEVSPYLIEIQNLNINRLGGGELQTKEPEKPSLGDISVTLSLKVFTKPR